MQANSVTLLNDLCNNYDIDVMEISEVSNFAEAELEGCQGEP